jgi:hypothetical protein
LKFDSFAVQIHHNLALVCSSDFIDRDAIKKEHIAADCKLALPTIVLIFELIFY